MKIDTTLKTKSESVSNINLLTAVECQKVNQTVHQLKQFWISQHPATPFYSLGTGSYFHVESGKLLDSNYYSLLQQYNPLLWDNFAWLYQRLADTLAKELNAPTQYSEKLALPGFHIFLSHKAFEYPVGKKHRDLQYLQHEWQENQARKEHISFTLALKLPQLGGGMNIWDLHHDEVDCLSQREVEDLARSRDWRFHPYELGSFALHSGHFLHQIAPATNIQPEDERITLQGHGTCDRGIWYLYW